MASDPTRAATRSLRLAAAFSAAVLACPPPVLAATDEALFRCSPAPAPLGQVCHLAPRSPTEPEADALDERSHVGTDANESPTPSESRNGSDARGTALAPETEQMLQMFLERELDKAEHERQRSPFVKDEHAPLSFSRLIEDPTRANAAAFLADQMELNLRHVKAQEAIRSVVLDLRSGRVDDDVVSGLTTLQSDVRSHAVQPRPPGEVLNEIRTDRLRQSLDASIHGASMNGAATPATPPPYQGPKGLELRYYFSPSCPHCSDMTPDIEALERRYGSALTIIGIPIQLEGETITPQVLRAYRRRFGLTFPFEERHPEIARAVTEDGLEAVPRAVVIVHGFPNGPVHVPLDGARTTAQIERALHEILAALDTPPPRLPAGAPSDGAAEGVTTSSDPVQAGGA